jgi:hypothetical protein
MGIRTTVLLLALALPGLAAACSAGGGEGGGWVAEVVTEGKVRTVRGSVWGAPARLMVEASIGGESEEEGKILGRVVSVAADSERIYVLDMQIPAVRIYDSQGVHLFDIGRAGSGPGEFRQPTSLAIDTGNGRLFVRDGSEGRINVYDRNGGFLETWRLNIGMQTHRPMVLTDEGRLFTPLVVNDPRHGMIGRWGMVACGPHGTTGDTLCPPELPFREAELMAVRNGRIKSSRVPFSSTYAWSMSGSGAMLAGVSEDYRLRVRHPDGRTTIIEKAWQPIPVLPEEKAWHRRAIVADMNRWLPDWAWNGPQIPDQKPAFSDLVSDRNGRIWVVRPGPGECLPGGADDTDDPQAYFMNPLWRDTPLVDVFLETGEYLGRVEVPRGIEWFLPVPCIDGDSAVAAVEGQGVLRVKRFRLQVPDR